MSAVHTGRDPIFHEDKVGFFFNKDYCPARQTQQHLIPKLICHLIKSSMSYVFLWHKYLKHQQMTDKTSALRTVAFNLDSLPLILNISRFFLSWTI